MILNANIHGHSVLDKTLLRGISLFTEIPKTRTCYDACIPEQYCPCYNREDISVDISLSKRIGNFIVSEINMLLKHAYISNICSERKLVKVLSNHRLSVPTDRNTQTDDMYFVGVRVHPADSEFMATVENVTSGSGMRVMGSIDRINKYGNQPRCLSPKNEPLKPYCYCIY